MAIGVLDEIDWSVRALAFLQKDQPKTSSGYLIPRALKTNIENFQRVYKALKHQAEILRGEVRSVQLEPLV